MPQQRVSSNQLKRAESVGTVTGGKLVGEYDFYNYLNLLEGQTVRWVLEVVESPTVN